MMILRKKFVLIIGNWEMNCKKIKGEEVSPYLQVANLSGFQKLLETVEKSPIG